MLDPVAQKVVGPHQWNVKVSHFTDDVLRVGSRGPHIDFASLTDDADVHRRGYHLLTGNPDGKTLIADALS